MKRLSLLSTFSALILTISLVGCNKIDDSIEDVNDSGSAEISITLSNYTLSLTILDDGKNIDLPWYDTIYIIGSWDGWKEFIPLTEKDGKYVTTFDKIQTGTYEFKGLVGLSFDEPSWSFTEIITDDGDAVKLDILRSDGNNYTKSLSFEISNSLLVLEESNLSNEEIANIILDSFDNIGKDGINWSAFYGLKTIDDEISEETYLSNDGGASYGKYVLYNENGNITKYIQSGNMYSIDENGKYEVDSYEDDYQDDLDTYTYDAVTKFCSLDNLNTATEYEITHEAESTYYAFSINGGAYTAICRRAGDYFVLYGLQYVNGSESQTAELINEADVEAQMENFMALDWTDLGQIFRQIEETNNYTILIEYYEVYSDYYYATTDELYEMYNEGNIPLYYRDMYVELIYTEDAILIEYFTSYSDAITGTPYDIEMFINDYSNNRTLLYWYNGSSTFHNSYYYYDGLWQDSMDTLLKLMPYRNNFAIGESIDGDLGLETVYDFAIDDADFFETLIYTMFYCDNWFVGEYVNGPDAFLSLYEEGEFGAFTYTSTYFNDLDEWDVILQTAPICWAAPYYGQAISWFEQDFMQAAVAHVGTSEIPDGFVAFIGEVNGYILSVFKNIFA